MAKNKLSAPWHHVVLLLWLYFSHYMFFEDEDCLLSNFAVLTVSTTNQHVVSYQLI